MAKNILKRIPYFEAVRAFLEQWGLWKPISAAVGLAVAAVYSAYTWFLGLPLWAIPLAGLSILTMLLAIVYYAISLYAYWVSYRKNLPQLGEDMVEFSNRFLTAVRDYERNNPVNTHPSNDRSDNDGDGHDAWLRRVEKVRQKELWIAEAFGGEILYFNTELRRVGVKVPFGLVTSLGSDAMSYGSFMNYAGRMIQSGRTELLKNTDDIDFFDLRGSAG